MTQLTRWNLDNPANGSQTLLQGIRLKYPLEVSPGEVMVRTCEPLNRAKDGSMDCFSFNAYHWLLTGSNGKAQIVGPQSMTSYTQPNVIGRGVYWIQSAESSWFPRKGDPQPHVLSYAVPNGIAPTFDETRLLQGTVGLACDNAGIRCLREFNSNIEDKKPGEYVYTIEVLLGKNACRADELTGFSDNLGITPDGSAAVISMASAHDKPRHVVLMRFSPQKCTPDSIQHIYFEDK